MSCHPCVCAVKPNAVTNLAVKTIEHSSIALSWVYDEPKPVGLVYRLQYQSQRRPAYQVCIVFCDEYIFVRCCFVKTSQIVAR